MEYTRDGGYCFLEHGRAFISILFFSFKVFAGLELLRCFHILHIRSNFVIEDYSLIQKQNKI